jgi:hypothetical protein
MSFSLTVLFSGLLHYVENRRNPSRSLCSLCVVLPKAPSHRALIRAFDGVVGTDRSTTAASIDFAGKRVVFQLLRSSASQQSSVFDFEGPVIDGNVKGAIPFRRILGTSADGNRRIVSASPPAVVNAQILIGGESTFSLDTSASPPEVEIPGTLLGGAGPSILTISEMISMRVAGLESARIVILPLEDSLSPKVVYSISPEGSGSHAGLLVSHDCAVAASAEPTLHIGDDDKDFRFHYSLLDALPQGLQLANMPVPKINKFTGNSENFRVLNSGISFKPNGCNCAGSSGLSRSYNLDKFMTA